MSSATYRARHSQADAGTLNAIKYSPATLVLRGLPTLKFQSKIANFVRAM